MKHKSNYSHACFHMEQTKKHQKPQKEKLSSNMLPGKDKNYHRKD